MIAIKDPETNKCFLALMPTQMAWWVALIWSFDPPRPLRVKEVTEKQAIAFNSKVAAE